MSASAPTTRSLPGGSAGASVARYLRRNSWVLGLWLLFFLLLLFTKAIQPDYGAAGLRILALAALPYAFATAGQTIVVISGGIDLSIAAMMTFIGVTAAVLMEGQPDEFGLLAVGLILLMGLVVGAINGAAVVITRVPDIVVTLAFFFIWEGAALMVTDHPAGSVPAWLRQLVLGTIGADVLPTEVTQWMPKALVLMLIAIGLVWIPLKRSRLGISMYAIGSDRLAAFRSGVAVDRTRVAIYALAGLFAAMGGLAIVMNTGVGSPIQGPYLLASVAAVVLGGVSLAGGKGGLVGPIVAVFILRLVRQDLTFLSIDPNVAQVIEGLIMVLVVMLGGVVALRNRHA